VLLATAVARAIDGDAFGGQPQPRAACQAQQCGGEDEPRSVSALLELQAPLALDRAQKPFVFSRQKRKGGPIQLAIASVGRCDVHPT
jgi:hypothetical protein